jgi:hypothetical protein
MGLIFMVSQLSTKTTQIWPLKIMVAAVEPSIMDTCGTATIDLNSDIIVLYTVELSDRDPEQCPN